MVGVAHDGLFMRASSTGAAAFAEAVGHGIPIPGGHAHGPPHLTTFGMKKPSCDYFCVSLGAIPSPEVRARKGW